MIMALASEIPTPTTYKQATEGPYAKQWQRAIESELNSLRDHGTWQPATLPKHKKPVTVKWVFKVKTTATGEVDKFKARLVARGFTQIQGEDYDSTYSPVQTMTTFRSLLARANFLGHSLRSIDICTAFLHSKIDAEIYVKFPTGYQLPPNCETANCLKLLKGIYGIKQGSRLWFLTLTKTLRAAGYKQSTADECLFVRGNLYMCFHIDDLQVSYRDKKDLDHLLTTLRKKFPVKDLGVATYALGIQITRRHGSLTLHQTTYISNLVGKYQGFLSHPRNTPASTKSVFKSHPKTSQPHSCPYRQLVGHLLYISNNTRPDITYAVNKCAKYMAHPSKNHWRALLRILAYLGETKLY
jgi:hypothetical protein